MSTTIYVVRHGFRGSYSINYNTGEIRTGVPTPTGIAADPALTSYGVEQAKQTGKKLISIEPKIERVYSSPFYRCIQTLSPYLSELGYGAEIVLDAGLGEWYGAAPFNHPQPAPPSKLQSLFPHFNLVPRTSIIPSIHGESIEELHNRIAYALSIILSDCLKEGIKTIVICGHAAPIIGIGRALTGRMPEDVEEEDFDTFTCGITKFVRRRGEEQGWRGVERCWKEGERVPVVDWMEGKGVGGGYDCVENSNCEHLANGAERGWHFSSDEAFPPAPGEIPDIGGFGDHGDAVGNVNVAREGKL